MNRREVLRSMAGGLAASLLASPGRLRGGDAPKRTQLGIVVYVFGIRQKAEQGGGRRKPLSDPVTFLEHCRQFGAGGVQLPMGVKDAAYSAQLRRKAEEHGMFLEGCAELPRDKGDLDRFDAEARTAAATGARLLRAVMMPGRRYEQFRSAEEFRESARRGLQSLQLAEPVAARHRMPLAVENHKDHRIPERLDVLKRLSSEYVGMCVDTGNSFTLLEDPMEVVEAYASWALSVHLKDQAVREYEDGFLFADVPLGEGFLDLKKMVQVLRQARPECRFSLELITRDPLKVPCLTPEYWATFAEVPGRDLARTLKTVRAKASGKPLPLVNHLPLDRQVAREEDNVKRSLAYASDQLGL